MIVLRLALLFLLVGQILLDCYGSVNHVEVAGTTDEVNYLVTNTNDNYDAQSSYCSPSAVSTTSNSNLVEASPIEASSSLCNLRSAWLACNDNSTILTYNKCTISLPRNGNLMFNISRGGMFLNTQFTASSSAKTVTVSGNNATVTTTPIVYDITPIPNANFPYTTSTLSNTNSTMQNYAETCFQAPGGVTLVFTTCNQGTGDTYLRLYQGSTNVASDDDYCDSLSQITYSTPSSQTTPLTYCLRMGCYGSSSCSMTVSAKIISVPVKPGYGYFVIANLPKQPSITASVPNLIMANMTFTKFDGSASTSLLSITGSLNLQISKVNFLNSFGGLIDQNNNMNGSILITNSLFSNVRGNFLKFGNWSTSTKIVNTKFNTLIGSSGSYFIYFNSNNTNFVVKNCQFTNVGGSYRGVVSLSESNRYGLFEDCTFTKQSSATLFQWSKYSSYITINRITYTNSKSAVYRMFSTSVSTNIRITNVWLQSIRFTGNGGVFGGSGSTAIDAKTYFANVTMINCNTDNNGLLGYLQNVKGVTIQNIQTNNVFLKYSPMFSCFQCIDVDMKNWKVTNARLGTAGGLLMEITSSTNISFTDVRGYNLTAVGTVGAMSFTGTNNVSLQRISLEKLYLPIGNGGGIYIGPGCSNYSLQDISIHSSIINQGSGGGIYIDQNVYNVSLVQVNISDTKVSDNGGAIYIGSAATLVRLSTLDIRSNYAGKSGGGVYVHENSNQVSLNGLNSWNSFLIVENDHPYNSNAFLPGLNPVVYRTTVKVKNAIGYILNFDPKTSLDKANSINIYTNSNLTQLLYTYTTTLFPGSNLPTCVINDPSFYIQLKGSGNYPQYNYGFKLHVYPLFANEVKSMFVNNIAGDSGGGMSFYFGHNFPIVTQTSFINNQAKASDGGGLNVKFGTRGLFMQNVDFMGNTAGYNGGGLIFSSGLFGSKVDQIYCVGNAAVKSGGGLYLGASNGYGTFTYSNEVNITNGYFALNTAEAGGAFYASDGNKFRLNRCLVQNNSASAEGGALSLQSINIAVIRNSIFSYNQANSVGGGIASDDDNTVVITNTSFNSNRAGFVGVGIIARLGSDLSLNQSVVFKGNYAGQAGGGLALLQCSLWGSDYTSKIRFLENTSPLGSALLVYSLVPSAYSIVNTSFISNKASQGGTVYWIYDSTMKQEPPGLQSSTVVFQDNDAQFGNRAATQALTLQSPPIYNVTIYGNSLYPPN